MRIIQYFFIAMLGLSLLSGCSWIHPYHPPIEQGNKLTDHQIHQIKKGMTREQVKDLLGEPVLKTPWQDHQMLYIYTYRPGTASKMSVKQRIVLGFKKGHVNHIVINSK